MIDADVPAAPGVYLAHFDQPFRHARNYLGASPNMQARVGAHRAGTGSKLLAAVQAAGIGWQISRVWPAATWDQARQLETGLKNRRDTPRICPGCTPGTTRAANPKPATVRTGPHHPPIRKPAHDPWAEPQEPMTTRDPAAYVTAIDPALAHPADADLLHHMHVPAATEPEPEPEAG